ncbi:MAG: chemotaxis protein CheB, partial [Cyanobacteria bacterium J06636_16]
MADHSEGNGGVRSITGIGASAGGIEAFSQILRNLPTDTGMGFVLVQHLDPKRASFLNELLDQITAMPVNTAEDDMVVRANQVYVISPNT